MKIVHYDAEHDAFRRRIQLFIEEEIKPQVDEWETNRIMPRSAWRKMGDQGFLSPSVSSDYGGRGLDFLYDIIITEELSKSDHNGAGPSTHNSIIVPYINTFASEELKKRFLPGCVSGEVITAIAISEPDAGSDVAAISTTAVNDGDSVVIDGSKIFITNGINCDLVLLVARDPAVENPYKALSLYLVEAGTPGFEKGKKLNKMGMYSQDTAELFFSKCRISKENIVGEPGKGFYMLMEKLQQERLITATWAISAAEYILDKTLSFYRENSGPQKLIQKSQAKQFSLVEMATEVKLGRTFLDTLIQDHAEGKKVVVEISMAKFWTTEMTRRVANGCLDLFDGNALLEKCPIVRYWRDSRSMSIFAGTNEIMRRIISKELNL